MQNQKDSKTKKQKLNPIGFAKIDESKGYYGIEINPEFRKALKEVEKFSHINILWWANRHDNPQDRAITQVSQLPEFYGENAPTMGIFATRSEYRPNPIALSSVKILALDSIKGIIQFPYFDAEDRTPILDIKPYLRMTDLITTAEYPPYLNHWPRSNEEAEQWWAEQMQVD